MAENNKRKWVVIGLAAALGVVLLIVLAGRGPEPQVQIVSVTREDLSASITGNGKVEPISPVVARAQFPTFVAEVKAAEGQSVHKGQLILALDAADIRAQLSQARADLLSAQTDLGNARAGGPPDEVAQLQGNLQNAQTQVANLERTQQVSRATGGQASRHARRSRAEPGRLDNGARQSANAAGEADRARAARRREPGEREPAREAAAGSGQPR